MKIAFQDTKIEFGELEKIATALDSLGVEPVSFGVIPFSNEITNCDDWTEPTLMMGSTKLAKMYLKNELPKHGVVFYSHPEFDQAYYHTKLGKKLLNHNALFYKYGAVKDRYIENKIFIKPSSDLKYFAGTVLNHRDNTISSELEKNCMIDTDLTDDIQVLINMDIICDILFEYRAFVVDNTIIDCCQYMEYGKVTPEILLNDRRAPLYSFIRKIQERYRPHDHYVIDIAELSDGSYKVIEYNCLNCSGMYANDRAAIYNALIKLDI